MAHYSATKKNETVPFAIARLDLEMVILSESARERHISCGITYTWKPKKKKGTDEFTCQTEIRVTDVENKLMVTSR